MISPVPKVRRTRACKRVDAGRSVHCAGILRMRQTSEGHVRCLYLGWPFGDDKCHDDISDYDGEMQASEESQHEQQAHDGRVNVEIFAESAAQAGKHTVGAASGKLFVGCTHEIAPFVFYRTYAG